MASESFHGLVLVLGQAGAVSGGDVHALRLAEYWRKSDPSVVIVGSPDLAGFIGEHEQDLLIPLATPLDSRMRSSSVALAIGVVWRGLRALGYLRRATIVVAGSHLIFDVLPGAIASTAFRKPVAAFVYHVIGDMNRPRSLRTRLAVALELFSLMLLRRIDATIFVDNAQARASLIRRGFQGDALQTTGQAYDPDFEIEDPHPLEPGRLIFVGRLVERKGIWDVVELGRRLEKCGSPLQIDVVGDGPIREEVVRVIDSEGIRNIHLHGFVDERTKWELLSRSTLFLAPSREEGWGIAVGEALLAGLPVVALDLPAYDHFPHQLIRAHSDGSNFVDLAMSTATDAVGLATLIEISRAGRHGLASWASILGNDVHVLNGLGETKARPGDRNYLSKRFFGRSAVSDMAASPES